MIIETLLTGILRAAAPDKRITAVEKIRLMERMMRSGMN
jgi:hypothetical protein